MRFEESAVEERAAFGGVQQRYSPNTPTAHKMVAHESP
jgi:hypothetical protein